MDMDKNITRYESLEEALTLTIRLANKQYKEVAHSLWPTTKPECATARLAECLNSSKNRKLTMDEIIHICHFCGRYDALYYMADECSHARPKIKTSAEEEHEIKEMFTNMQATLNKSFEMFQLMIQRKEKRDMIKDGNIHYMEKFGSK